MFEKDTRWKRRFQNLKKAFSRLEEGVSLARKRELTNLEEQGLIQAFEFTHELAWKTLKDFLEDKGLFDLYGSKDTTREAFKAGLIENGEAWMEMIISRNLTSHTYDETTAAKISGKILNSFFLEFEKLIQKLEPKAEEKEK